jgi:hypothetical protein
LVYSSSRPRFSLRAGARRRNFRATTGGVSEAVVLYATGFGVEIFFEKFKKKGVALIIRFDKREV